MKITFTITANIATPRTEDTLQKRLQEMKNVLTAYLGIYNNVEAVATYEETKTITISL